MSYIDRANHQINCKVAYCGPAGAGKRTALRYILERASGAPVTDEDLADPVILSLGRIRTFNVEMHLYRIPEDPTQNLLFLKGSDGIVFVADSQEERLADDLEALELADHNLAALGYGDLPRVVAYNKRDLPNATPVEEMRRLLNPGSSPDFECIATTGAGVFDALKAISKMVLTLARP